MGKKQRMMVLCSVVLFVTSIAGADTYTMIFNTSDNQFDPGVDNQGWWSATESSYDENDNYSTGIDYKGRNPNNFFTFDLSSLHETAISATLELRRAEYVSIADSEIFGLFDVTTDPVVLNNNIGPDISIYNDLCSGISYGEFEVFSIGNEDDILQFELNVAAIDAINSAGGWFSIGGTLLSPGSPVPDGTERLFGRSTGYGTQRLVIEIPEPCTLSILSLGSIFLIRRR